MAYAALAIDMCKSQEAMLAAARVPVIKSQEAMLAAARVPVIKSQEAMLAAARAPVIKSQDVMLAAARVRAIKSQEAAARVPVIKSQGAILAPATGIEVSKLQKALVAATGIDTHRLSEQMLRAVRLDLPHLPEQLLGVSARDTTSMFVRALQGQQVQFDRLVGRPVHPRDLVGVSKSAAEILRRAAEAASEKGRDFSVKDALNDVRDAVLEERVAAAVGMAIVAGVLVWSYAQLTGRSTTQVAGDIAFPWLITAMLAVVIKLLLDSRND